MSATLQTSRLLTRPAVQARVDWQSLYRRRLVATDALAVVIAVVTTQLVWFGLDSQQVDTDKGSLALTYTAVSSLFALGWMFVLRVLGTRDHRIIGNDLTEYRRVIDASLRLFGAIGIAAFLLKVDLARGYFLSALPIGLIALLASRWLWRRWLKQMRRRGEFCARLLVVGSAASVEHLAGELKRYPTVGYSIVGACILRGTADPGATRSREADTGSFPGGASTVPLGFPTWSDLDGVLGYMDTVDADTVAITNSEELTATRVRKISWDLEPGRRHLIIAPSLTDVAGPRIHTRPVAGLPFLHVETPRFDGGKFISKRVFDVIGAGVILGLLLPLLLAIAALVKLTSAGPVMYRSERIGRGGAAFGMLKVRSMRVGAEHELPHLLVAQGTHTTPLFKVRDDPRVTAVGRVLRKYSLDELPQLINVLRGDMSLVGPRPQIASEVALYTSDAERRLLLKPGMSGLWQVSGRSSLSWEESVRLDLFYVENWSMLGDLIILARTARAVVAPGREAF